MVRHSPRIHRPSEVRGVEVSFRREHNSNRMLIQVFCKPDQGGIVSKAVRPLDEGTSYIIQHNGHTFRINLDNQRGIVWVYPPQFRGIPSRIFLRGHHNNASISKGITDFAAADYSIKALASSSSDNQVSSFISTRGGSIHSKFLLEKTDTPINVWVPPCPSNLDTLTSHYFWLSIPTGDSIKRPGASLESKGSEELFPLLFR